jgi:hypothetical protein
MITIKEVTIIKASPENIFNFLTSIDSLYKTWHPKDHVFCKRIYKDLNERGCLFHFLETIGAFPLYLILTVSKIKKNEYIEYRPIFPLSVFNLGKGSFAIERVSDELSKLTAYVEYGNHFGLLDRIFQLFVKTEMLKKHIEEEGQNIKNYLEQNT